MRTLLVFIVVLNLLYAGWEYLNPTVKVNELKPLATSLKRLQLLNEEKINALKAASMSRNDVADNQQQKLPDDMPVTESSEITTCYTLGPFKDENIMLQLRDSIAEYVNGLSVRKRAETVKHRYWVYVPALANKKLAKLTAKKLRKKHINDFYIVLSGGEKNSISLGHFREPKHANRRMKKVQNLGFKAEIKVIYREYDIYWLDYQIESTEGESGFSVEEYISDGVSQLERACKG